MGVWRSYQWSPGAKPQVGVWQRSPQKLMTLCCENVLFCYGFKNDSDTCIHCLQVFNIKWKKSVWRQKSGRASNNTCPLGTKSGRQLPALPNQLRHECIFANILSRSESTFISTIIAGHYFISFHCHLP